MKFAIIKERKDPPDKRVVLTPEACKLLKNTFSQLELKVESSENRSFSDDQYRKVGLEITDHIDDCDVMLGVKEVPIDALKNNPITETC